MTDKASRVPRPSDTADLGPRTALVAIAIALGAPRLAARLAAWLGLDSAERAALESAAAHRRGVSDLANMRCPLCGAEIENAWTVDPAGQLGARRASTCPHCDFRLDSCRHCAHFLPGGSTGSLTGWPGAPGVAFGDADYTQGRCGVYRAFVSIYDLYDPATADRLAVYAERIRVPKPIADSYLPLTECNTFQLSPRRLRHSGARLDRAWQAWLRWTRRP